MRVGGFEFKPTLIPSVITVMVMAMLLALGFWQLERARQKALIQEDFKTRATLPTVPITTVDLTDAASRFREVIAKGRYDARHQILLDNQVQNGRPGFHVLTPLQVPGLAKAILVNRCWVPLGESRQQLPDIALNENGKEVAISGRLGQPANPGLRLSAPVTDEPDWPRVVQYVDYSQLSAELGYPLAPAVILLDPRSENGYRREWQLQMTRFGPQRHQGYAVQWFSLAATLMVIYLVVNTQRSKKADSDADPAP
jgi:surfeit locus 1 family protein